MELAIDHGWRCPACGFEVFSGQPAQFHPPTCSFGHPPTEMEQVLVTPAVNPYGEEGHDG